jgi:uncharacterized protein DUF1566
MERQSFLAIVGLMKHSLTAMSRSFLSVLAILVLVPAVAAAGDPLSSWDKQINAKGRFEVLPAFANAAVLDKETQLVWEQSPATTHHSWSDARFQCTSRTVGGRKGWRLPSVHELASLVDPSVPPPGPTLPSGHPFTNVQLDDVYWSATTNADDTITAWFVYFFNGFVSIDGREGRGHVWCVRGAMNADVY